MKLLAAVVNGQTLGVEKLTWDTFEFSGAPFIVIEDFETIPTGRTDISSIITWGSFGEVCNMNYVQVRNELQKLIPNDVESLTIQEKDILREYNLYKYFKIYDRISNSSTIISSNPPIDIDYDLLGYNKKRFFNKGELEKVEYHENFDQLTNVYSGRVVEELRTYYRINQMLSRREMVINWLLEDGTTGWTKNTVKYYAQLEAIQAGVTRRDNVIANLKIEVLGLIMMSSGVTAVQAQQLAVPFLDTYTVNITKYIQGFEEQLRTAILNDTITPWLDLVIPNTGGITIRQYLISELTIDYTINNVNI